MMENTLVQDVSNMSQYEIDAVVDFINTHSPKINPPIMTQDEIDLLIEFIEDQGIRIGYDLFTEDDIDELNYRRFT